MINFKKALLAAAIAVPGVVAVAVPAHAQVAGVAVADPDAAIAGSKAWQAAKGQIATTYATQIAQAEARRNAIQTELQPLYTSFEAARNAPNANETTLRTQATAIQTKEQAGQAELARITAPAARAQAYVIEQIRAKMPDAVTNATRAKGVSLLIAPNAALFAQPTADITSTVTAQLDVLIPSVGITPPANWQPGQQQGGAAPAAAAAAPRPTPARPATSGR